MPPPLSFSDWVRQAFDHPVKKPEWYWDIEEDVEESAPEQLVGYLTRLFTDPVSVLKPYSDAQLNQGFWYLVNNSCSNTMFCLLEPWAAWPARRDGIRSIATLFERLFALRCSEHLSHLEEQGASVLNLICYMWWDLFPRHGIPDPKYAEVDAELLVVMKRIVALDSLACQESALHGLGHWQLYYPDFVQEKVDKFMDSLRPEVREYAQHARRGHVN